jgi:hypothetical protein
MLLSAAYIDGIVGQTTGTGSTPVFIDNTGKLGTTNSTSGTYVQTVEADMGSATASSGTIFLHASTAGANSGATISFTASTDVINLNTTDSSSNVTIGTNAGGINVINGTFNTSVGSNSLNLANGASDNTALGYAALNNLVSGTENTAIGFNAGSNLTSNESNNIYINNEGVTAESNTIRIGPSGTGAQTSCYIQGIANSTVVGSAVFVTAAGQLGVLASLRHLKENIINVDVEENHQIVTNLSPKQFNFINDETKTPMYGLIVDEVEPIAPNLIVKNNDVPVSIKYQELNILLLAEVQRLNTIIDKQGKCIEELTAWKNTFQQ